MKTIEERALEWAHVLVSVNSRPATSELLTQIAEMSYSQGATDQRAIDTEKACETFKATCKEQGAGSCDREWLCDGCKKYESFRKAMKVE